MNKSEKFTQNLNVEGVSAIWFIMNTANCFLQIGTEAWILTLVKPSKYGNASVARSMGINVGQFVAYNLFVPLNSIDWLTSHFRFKAVLTEPVFTHQGVMMIIVVYSMVVTLYLMLFVEERKIPRHKRLSGHRLRTTFSHFLVKRESKNFFILSFFTRVFLCLIFEQPIDLEFIKLGIKKTELVNISSIFFPVQMLVNFLSSYFLLPKTLARGYTLVNMYYLAITTLLFFSIISLAETHDSKTGFLHLCFGKFLLSNDRFEGIWWLAIVNHLCDESIGATAITTFAAFSNACTELPRTIGLWLAGEVDSYEKFGMPVIVSGFVFFALIWPHAEKMDKEDFHEER
jgi:hypothetical protein